MIEQLNDNVACVVSGYKLLVDLVNNHESQISELKSSVINPIQQISQTVIHNNIENSERKLEKCISSSQIAVGANVDILSLSNVETDDGGLLCIEKESTMYVNTHGENTHVASTPKPIGQSNVEKDARGLVCIEEEFLCEDTHGDITHLASTPKPASYSQNNISNQTKFGSFSDISDISSLHESENLHDKNVASVPPCTPVYNSNQTNFEKFSDMVDPSLSKEGSNSYHNDQSQPLYITPKINNVPLFNCNLDHLPYELHDYQIFNLFEDSKLDDSTVFTHLFSNRSAAYYGVYPYTYGRTYHEPRDFSENPYLLKLLNYVEIVYPTFSFNSALIHKYKSGDQFIPHHSDSEEDIEDDSMIITISLGATRSFEFKEVGGSGWSDTVMLNHGDSLVMSKKSQRFFTHGIPKEKQVGKRLSVTLRLMKPEKHLRVQKQTGTQTEEKTCPQVVEPVVECQIHQSIQDLNQTEYDDITESTHNSVPDDASQDGYQPETRGYQPETKQRRQDDSSQDGYQSEPSQRVHRFSDFKPGYHYQRKGHLTSNATNNTVDTLYISSSMFRNLDSFRLSSECQNAEVLFYPGANVSQMLDRVFKDPKFNEINKGKVKKVFIMTGTNNVDSVFDGACSFTKVENDIYNLLHRLWVTFGDAQLYVINLLPRQHQAKNKVVININCYIEKLCNTYGLVFVNTDKNNNHCFSDERGIRKDELFSKGYDNVHLNGVGYSILARYLKYLAHIKTS